MRASVCGLMALLVLWFFPLNKYIHIGQSSRENYFYFCKHTNFLKHNVANRSTISIASIASTRPLPAARQRHVGLPLPQLKFSTFNVRSLRNKVDATSHLFTTHGIDILCLTETWHEDADDVPTASHPRHPVDWLLQSRTEDLPVWLFVTESCRDSATVVNRMVDARPCNVFVVLRRVRNSRTIIIIIIMGRIASFPITWNWITVKIVASFSKCNFLHTLVCSSKQD